MADRVISANGRDWITAQQISEIWPDVQPATVRQWASRGKVNGHRVGRETYYDLNDLTEAEHAARTATRGHKRGSIAGATNVVTFHQSHNCQR